MLYELILVTAVGVQPVGMYDDYVDCTIEAENWQDQGVPAGCVQQMEPDDAFNKFLGILNQMEQIQQRDFDPYRPAEPAPCPGEADCIELE